MSYWKECTGDVHDLLNNRENDDRIKIKQGQFTKGSLEQTCDEIQQNQKSGTRCS